jgi:hypothetical protein
MDVPMTAFTSRWFVLLSDVHGLVLGSSLLVPLGHVQS